jgi:hypothetical protein
MLRKGILVAALFALPTSVLAQVQLGTPLSGLRSGEPLSTVRGVQGAQAGGAGDVPVPLNGAPGVPLNGAPAIPLNGAPAVPLNGAPAFPPAGR